MALAGQALPGPMPTMELRASSLTQTRPRGGAKGEAVSWQNSDRVLLSPLLRLYDPACPPGRALPTFHMVQGLWYPLPGRVSVSQDIALVSNREGSSPSLGDSSLLTSLLLLFQF